MALALIVMSQSVWLLSVMTMEEISRALAGVGSPIKLVVWRLSMLNFARRRAENAATSKATILIYFIQLSAKMRSV